MLRSHIYQYQDRQQPSDAGHPNLQRAAAAAEPQPLAADAAGDAEPSDEEVLAIG